MGAPGVGQSHPTLPPPRRLLGVLVLPSYTHNRNNNWNNNQQTYTTGITPMVIRTLFSSFNHFLPSFSTLFIPYPTKTSLFPPEGPAMTEHSRTEEGLGKRKKKIEYCCTIPFINLARFRLHLNFLN